MPFVTIKPKPNVCSQSLVDPIKHNSPCSRHSIIPKLIIKEWKASKAIWNDKQVKSDPISLIRKRVTISVLIIHVNKQFQFLLTRQDIYPILSYQILVVVSKVVSCGAFILHRLSSKEIGCLCGQAAVYMQKDKDMRSSPRFIVFVGAKEPCPSSVGEPLFSEAISSIIRYLGHAVKEDVS